MLGFGAFVMMQRQMIGIRSRAEQLAMEEALPPIPAPETAGNGHAADVPETVIATTDAT